MRQRSNFALCAGSLAGIGGLFCGAALAQPAPELTAFAQRDQVVARIERLSELQLKAVVLRCSRESSERLMGFGEAVPCIVAWDALKARSFGGDFNALLAWWRTHRDDPDTALSSE